VIDRIRRSLTLAYVGILAVILMLVGAVTVVSFRLESVEARDELLLEKAQGTAALLDRGGTLDFPMASDADDYGVALFAPGRAPVRKDDTAPRLGLPAEAPARVALARRAGALTTIAAPQGDVRVASVPLARPRAGASVLQVAAPDDAVAATVRRLVFVLLPVCLGALGLALLGGLVVSRRAMAPVREAFARQRSFVADASHELRTPLALVKVDAEVLRRNAQAADADAVLGHQLAEIDRMDALLADLLLLARLDAGRLDVRREPFDLGEVLEDVVRRFAPRAIDGEVTLHLELADTTVAHADEQRTAQVLAAVVDNALRHTLRGGHVALSSVAVDGHVEARVDDDGAGLDAEGRARAFERFHTRTGAGGRGGTGLGLAIARDLARAQGGELTVEERPETGASFRLTLPRARQGAPPSE